MPYFHKTWVPAPNTVQLEAVYSTYGGFAENVFHVQGNGPITDIAGLAQQLITTYQNWETAFGRQLRSSAYGLRKVSVRDIGQQNGPVWENSQLIVGTRTPDPVPDNATIAVKWITGRGGRSYRGRSYHIGLTVDMVSGDQLSSAVQTPMLTAYNALLTAISGVAWNSYGPTQGSMVVVSASHNKVARATAEITPITQAVFADFNLDSQRRRLRGRGT